MQDNKPANPLIEISENVTRLLTINIFDAAFKAEALHYYISDMVNNVLHKGVLYNKKTELDLAHLPAGLYYFHVLKNGEQIDSILFVKRSAV